MSLGAGSRLGPYEVVALVGAGNMGEVYRARDTRLHRDVAVKIITPGMTDSPARRARFEREAQAISRLSHRNICAIYDVGEHDGAAFLVMEYIDGESLEERLRLGPIPLSVALPTAIQIAAAVDAAHDRGIVHRDLKPANVMMASSGVKLLDFGIAKLLDEDAVSDATSQTPAATKTLTAEHKVVGTLNYMAPEQLEGRPADRRTDVFALGAVIYEMVTGRKAFDGSSSASVTVAVLTAEPPPMASVTRDALVPPALDHVVRRALAKNPDERWQTARDMMHELRWILDEPPHSSARPVGSGTPHIRRLPLALGALAVALMGAAIGWRARPSAPAHSGEPLAVFTVTAPAGTRFPAGYAMLAVSPDGLKVAFLATRDGTPTIWLRYLNSPLSEQLLNTEGANSPFWSPDSQSVGFFSADGKLIKRVEISGGQPAVVTKVNAIENPQGACWLPDGTIVFAADGRLARAPAAGGDAVPFAAPNPTRNERAYLLPSALNGGRVVYLVRRNAFELSESQIAALAGGPTATLPTVRSNVLYASGHLIFRQGTALVAQPFDEGTLRLRDHSTVLAENVNYNPGNGRTVFSASADVLAYRTDVPRKLTWIDRSGRRLGLVGEAGRDWNQAIAPDGSGRVAVDRFDAATGQFHVSAIDDQGRSTVLTHGVKERMPVWSGDGQWIAYVMPSASGTELHRIRSSGTGGDELLFRIANVIVSPLDVSRDGRFIVYQGGGDLWALPLTGADRTPVQLTSTPALERQARLSPDGRWLAYSVATGGQPSLWIQAFPKGSPHRISANTGFDPSWRQDGRELYYITEDGKVTAVSVSADTPPVFGPPVVLFQIEPGAIHVPLHVLAGTPDGQRFLVSEPTETDGPITIVVHWPRLVQQ